MLVRIVLKAFLALFVLGLASDARAQVRLSGFANSVRQTARILKREKPPTSDSPSIERVLKQIDWLEHRLDSHGSVVAQQASIWGESRLTKHRHEYEQELATRIGEFNATLQGSLRRSDSSVIAASVGVGQDTPDPLVKAEGNLIIQTGEQNLNELLKGFNSKESTYLSLEPTVHNEQLSRYLRHLNELRRINEGDDTSDSPGYALNLVRIPISVLPGTTTQTGYGAEVTLTASPRLTEDLLPNTFRDLVINDIIDELALPITKLVNDRVLLRKLEEFVDRYDRLARNKEQIDRFLHERDNGNLTQERRKMIDKRIASLLEQSVRDIEFTLGQEKALQIVGKVLAESGYTDFAAELSDVGSLVRMPDVNERLIEKGLGASLLYAEMEPFAREFKEEVLEASGIQQVRRRRAPLPYPKQHLNDIFGSSLHVLGHIALEASATLKPRGIADLIQLPDVENFLQSELQAAFKFLASHPGQNLWVHCNPELVESIRQRRRQPHRYDGWRTIEKDLQYHTLPSGTKSTIALRDDFFRDLKINHPRVTHSASASLVWAILVESALLNDRLATDIQEVAKAKGCGCGFVDTWMDFYQPNPSSAAREAFNEYVRCRWPIQVFAIDPVAQDQNIADSLSRRREMQLAIALSISQGNTPAGAAGRLMRRIEADFDTIALNRTAVGFAHGGDTFGWRFYPRFQSPPTPGTLGALCETFFGADRANDLRRRQIEPGVRECLAMVIMPSFVRYVDLHSKTSWFRLTNPRRKELTVSEGVELGQTLTSIQGQVNRICNARCYRAEDITNLTTIVTQLERRLPNQQMIVEVPYENTLGGFELFSNGVTDLGPELRGYYGAPGVYAANGSAGPCDCKHGKGTAFSNDSGEQCVGTCCGTNLFLVGDRFSVHDTRVLAGGRCVAFSLISREIMRVTIPYDVRVNQKTDNGYGDTRRGHPANHEYVEVQVGNAVWCVGTA